MKDSEILADVTSVCDGQFEMEGDNCVAASFYDKSHVLESTIRTHPEKQWIIQQVAKLPYLRTLNLRKARLGSLPCFMSQSLETVDLSCNGLTHVPSWLYIQPNLRVVNLGANSLTEVGTFDVPLTSLKLHKNQLTSIGQLPLTLKLLNLYMTNCPKIPHEVFQMDDLESLAFGLSPMLELPMLPFPKLRALMVVLCDITVLPDSICWLPALSRLILAKNHLTQLPENIGDLTALRSLSLYGNRLATLPDSFYDLDLQQLNVVANPLTDERKQELKDVFGGINYFRM